MNADIALITERKHVTLPHLSKWLAKAAEWTCEKYNVDDLVGFIFRRDVMLWLVFDKDTNVPFGFLTTMIQQHPQTRVFCIMHCAGDEGTLESCVDLVFDTMELYAIESGCDGLEVIGRPAWWKHVKDRGYDQPQRQYFKKLGS